MTPLSRRKFLVGGVQVTLAASTLRSGAKARWFEPAGERVLVVLQLSGGNDGLNMLVPHRQDAYFRSRPTLGLARESLHALDDAHGFHPALGGLAGLFADGRLAAVHGVGYPDPDRSHFRSMEIWHTGELTRPVPEVGWLGRIADELVPSDPAAVVALRIGGGDLQLALRGRSFVAPTVEDAEQFRLREIGGAATRARGTLLEARSGPPDLAFLRETARTTYRFAERVQSLASGTTSVAYPGSELAKHLHLTARLIAGGLGARVFHVELEGFDTHAQQARTHAALLGDLSESLASFQADLREHGVDERVLVLVFSEFGRRVEENGSKGTDHGAAAPVLLVGSRVRGGLHGTPPDLARLVDGDVAFTTDFRSIYAELAQTWLGVRWPDAPARLPLVV